MTCRRSQVRVLYRPPRVPRPKGLGTFFVVDGTGLEQHGTAAGGATNTPVGCLLVRGSQRIGMSTKKDAVRPFGLGTFFVVDGTGLEQQRRRPPPAAETGSRGWGRVLIFQSPAKGLRKNQQTQPVQAPAVRFRQGSQRLGMSTKKDAARPFDLGLFRSGGTGREPERAKAGYHRGDGILPFVLICFISRSQHPLQYSLRENSP